MNIVNLFNLWQEEWLLQEKVEFDGIRRQIVVHPDVSEFTIRSDIYSAWKRWVRLQNNAAFAPAIRVIGGDPVGGGEFAGDIYFLQNDWKVVVDHFVEVDGILYSDDGSNPYTILAGGGVRSTVSSLTQTIETGGGGGSTDIGAIWSAQHFTNQQAGSFGAAIRDIFLRLPEVQTAIAGVQATATGTRADVGAVQTDIAGIANQVTDTNADLAVIGDKVDASSTEVSALDTKLTSVETKVDTVNVAVAAVETKIDAVQTTVTATDGKVDTLATEITTLQTSVSEVDNAPVLAAVSAVETKVDGVDAKIIDLGTDVEAVGVNVTAVQSALDTVGTKVDGVATDVTAMQTDVTSVLGNLATATDLINTLLKYESNRTKVDQNAKTLTVFDNDGVTPLKVFSLRNFLGQPSVSEVAERSPI